MITFCLRERKIRAAKDFYRGASENRNSTIRCVHLVLIVYMLYMRNEDDKLLWAIVEGVSLAID